ncbi:hypothetical protein MMC22_000797 [Lobaria immixta]|nr:hypothetical protein [Lobaria immixta]
MATHRALVLSSFDKLLSLEIVSRPKAEAGQVVVRVLAISLVPYMQEILNGTLAYPLSLPMTPGLSAIGRVEQIGPDAVSLSPGQLVFCDVTVRGRDDPSVTMMIGIHGGGYPAAQKLMDGEWRNATFAEFAKFPLENVFALDEEALTKSKGYSVADLCWLSGCLVPYGGLREIGVIPGDVVIVAPATGRFGGAAVTVALAMGAKVIAAGRNKAALDALRTVFAPTGRIKTVALSGDAAKDTEELKSATGNHNGADAYIDFSPAAAASSSHIVAALSALRSFGKCALMGGIFGNISIPYGLVMFKSLRLQGRFMYEPSHITQLIQMVEADNLKLGAAAGIKNHGPFGLDKITEALKAAASFGSWGSQVIVQP